MSAIPNNPQKAYMLGKRHGTRDTLALVSMVLTDKAGWTIKDDDPDNRQTVKWLADEMEKLAKAINEGRIKRRDIRDALKDEESVEFT